ncbi:MAG: GNAT family N-acetyltransferase [Bacillus sp. (in: firmicutes)]
MGVITTKETVRAFDMLDASFVQKRMSGIEGTEIKAFGHTLAFFAKEQPRNEQFNSIRGFRQEDAERLAEIFLFYKEKQQKVRMDLLPGEVNVDVAKQLKAHGLLHTDFQTVFFRRNLPDEKGFLHPHVYARKIGKDELETFLRVYLTGFGIPGHMLSVAMEQRYFWKDIPEFHLYLAEKDGRAAAAAVLHVQGIYGYMAGASTLPEYRGSGCQQALLHARMNDAARNGCKLFGAEAQFGSASHRNIERLGFQVAYTKAIYRQV